MYYVRVHEGVCVGVCVWVHEGCVGVHEGYERVHEGCVQGEAERCMILS